MNSESALQCKCVKDFNHRRPLERGRFFSIHNNADNRIQGAIAVALGRWKGVSDTMYMGPKSLYCLEFKDPEGRGRLSEWQVKWMVNVVRLPYVKYRVIDSEEKFWAAIKEADNE